MIGWRSVYECHTLTDQQRMLIVSAVEQAIPRSCGVVIPADLRELLGLLRDAHKLVLKNKHTRTA